MTALVRPRSPADLDACVGLLAEVHLADGYPDVWPDEPAAWLSPRSSVGAWVAELDGRLVGHVAARPGAIDESAAVWSAHTGLPPERFGAIKRMFAAPERRGTGIGAALLETACAALVSLDLHPALDVVDTNRAAIAFYERHGWVRVAAAQWPHPPPGRSLLFYVASLG